MIKTQLYNQLPTNLATSPQVFRYCRVVLQDMSKYTHKNIIYGALINF
jgi:hypothetical protein